MTVSDIVHEAGRHYVVRVVDDYDGQPIESYEVRRSGIVRDRIALVVSGPGAREHACAQADRLSGKGDSR